MAEADVNAALYVQFEADSNVISAARIAVGGILSSAAAAYDMTQLLAGRFVASVSCCRLNLNLICNRWVVGRRCRPPYRGWSLGAPPHGKFWNFQVKMQGLCIFIAKNYLWPETGTWELNRPSGG